MSFFFFLAAFIFVTRIEDIVATQLPVTWLVGAGKAEEKKFTLLRCLSLFLAAFYIVTRSEDIIATQVPVTWVVGIGEAEGESSFN